MTNRFRSGSGKAILSCEYCGKLYVDCSWLSRHEIDCRKNPEVIENES